MMTSGSLIVPSEEEIRQQEERNMKTLGIYKMFDGSHNPEKATDGSACFDLKAYISDTPLKAFDLNNTKFEIFPEMGEVILPSWCRVMIPTGLIFDIPDGYSMRLHPRSGLALKHGLKLANCEGVVDNDYVEQTYVVLFNCADVDYVVKDGDKVCQAELERSVKFKVMYQKEAPRQKTSRKGGFGHTGY